VCRNKYGKKPGKKRLYAGLARALLTRAYCVLRAQFWGLVKLVRSTMLLSRSGVLWGEGSISITVAGGWEHYFTPTYTNLLLPRQRLCSPQRRTHQPRPLIRKRVSILFCWPLWGFPLGATVPKQIVRSRLGSSWWCFRLWSSSGHCTGCRPSACPSFWPSTTLYSISYSTIDSGLG